MRHAPLRAGLTVLVLLAASACSDDGAPDSEATVASGDPAACPGEVLDVVVSVAAWSDVVSGSAGTAPPSRRSPPRRPGRPTTSWRPTGPRSPSADLVVLNGARYDQWAVEALEDSDGDPVVVTAADVAGAGAARPDPQLWYAPEVVPEVAAAVTRELAVLSPDAAPYFDAQHTAWTAELQPYVAAVAALREGAAGRTGATTLTAWGPMARAVGLAEGTPSAFLRSLRSGSDPAPDDVDDVEAALREGSVDVLVQDGAADDGTADRLRDVAEDAGVPVVEVTEFPPRGRRLRRVAGDPARRAGRGAGGGRLITVRSDLDLPPGLVERPGQRVFRRLRRAGCRHGRRPARQPGSRHLAADLRGRRPGRGVDRRHGGPDAGQPPPGASLLSDPGRGARSAPVSDHAG